MLLGWVDICRNWRRVGVLVFCKRFNNVIGLIIFCEFFLGCLFGVFVSGVLVGNRCIIVIENGGSLRKRLFISIWIGFREMRGMV